MDSTVRLHVSLLLIGVVLGTQFPASKVAVASMDPLSLTAVRTGTGALVGIAALALRGRWDARAIRSPLALALGGLLALVYLTLNTGIERTTASKTALLLNVSVVYVAIFMVVFFRERATRAKTIGILASLGGVVILTTRLDPNFLAGGEIFGDALVFVSGLTWASFVIVAKHAVDRSELDAWSFACVILATTAVLVSLPLLVLGISLPSSAPAWAALLYVGLVPTFLPLWLMIYSLRTVSPTISALLILPAVFVAAVLSFALLQDPIDASTWLGGGFVLAGAYIVTRESGSPVRPPMDAREV